MTSEGRNCRVVIGIAVRLCGHGALIAAHTCSKTLSDIYFLVRSSSWPKYLTPGFVHPYGLGSIVRASRV